MIRSHLRFALALGGLMAAASAASAQYFPGNYGRGHGGFVYPNASQMQNWNGYHYAPTYSTYPSYQSYQWGNYVQPGGVTYRNGYYYTQPSVGYTGGYYTQPSYTVVPGTIPASSVTAASSTTGTVALVGPDGVVRNYPVQSGAVQQQTAVVQAGNTTTPSTATESTSGTTTTTQAAGSASVVHQNCAAPPVFYSR